MKVFSLIKGERMRVPRESWSTWIVYSIRLGSGRLDNLYSWNICRLVRLGMGLWLSTSYFPLWNYCDAGISLLANVKQPGTRSSTIPSVPPRKVFQIFNLQLK